MPQPAADFCRVWEASASLDEVARHTGLSKRVASVRASRYRTEYGVELKRFTDRVDADALNAELRRAKAATTD